MLENKEYYLVSWSPVGGSTVYLGPMPLNIDICMNQFVNGQISRYIAIRFVTTHLNYNLPKFKGVKGDQLSPKDPVNAPMQTD